MSHRIFVNGNLVPVMGPSQAAGISYLQGDKFYFKKNSTSSLPRDLSPLQSWEVLLTALGGKTARWVSPAECEWCAVIRVMMSLGNDLKNFSNEIPCRSLEQPTSTNPFQRLGSEQTLSSMKSSTFKACFDMALNKEEQVPALDFYSFTPDSKKEDRLISFVVAVRVLDFWPEKGHSGDFVGGSQWRFLIREALEGKSGWGFIGRGFLLLFLFSRKVEIQNSATK